MFAGKCDRHAIATGSGEGSGTIVSFPVVASTSAVPAWRKYDRTAPLSRKSSLSGYVDDAE
jgi:hypothetical protein